MADQQHPALDYFKLHAEEDERTMKAAMEHADPQHPDWNYRCNLWRAGLGPDPGPPPPDPQHPDIAALVERLDVLASDPYRHYQFDLATVIRDAAAALRTLARPVEPIEPVEPTEPTAEDEEMVAGLIGFLRDDLAPACRREGCRLARPVEDEEDEAWQARDNLLAIAENEEPEVAEPLKHAASLIASLAWEKASVEQERDEARQNAVTAAEALRMLGLSHVEQGREAARLRKALLDATAHLAGATSAYEKFVGNSERRGVRDALYKTRLADFQKATGRAQATCRALAAAAGAEEPDQCPKCKDYVGRCPVCGRKRPSIEETRRALEKQPR